MTKQGLRKNGRRCSNTATNSRSSIRQYYIDTIDFAPSSCCINREPTSNIIGLFRPTTAVLVAIIMASSFSTAAVETFAFASAFTTSSLRKTAVPKSAHNLQQHQRQSIQTKEEGGHCHRVFPWGFATINSALSSLAVEDDEDNIDEAYVVSSSSSSSFRTKIAEDNIDSSSQHDVGNYYIEEEVFVQEDEEGGGAGGKATETLKEDLARAIDEVLAKRHQEEEGKKMDDNGNNMNIAVDATAIASAFNGDSSSSSSSNIGSTLQQLTDIIDEEIRSIEQYKAKPTSFIIPDGYTPQARNPMTSLRQHNKVYEHQLEKERQKEKRQNASTSFYSTSTTTATTTYTYNVAIVFGKSLINDQITVEYAERIRTLANKLLEEQNKHRNDNDDQPPFSLICFCGNSDRTTGTTSSSNNHMSCADVGYMYFKHLCQSNNIELSSIDIFLDRRHPSSTNQDVNPERETLRYVIRDIANNKLSNWIEEIVKHEQQQEKEVNNQKRDDHNEGYDNVIGQNDNDDEENNDDVIYDDVRNDISNAYQQELIYSGISFDPRYKNSYEKESHSQVSSSPEVQESTPLPTSLSSSLSFTPPKRQETVKATDKRRRVRVHFTLISSDYHLCNVNDIHHRSPRQSALLPLIDDTIDKEYQRFMSFMKKVSEAEAKAEAVAAKMISSRNRRRRNVVPNSGQSYYGTDDDGRADSRMVDDFYGAYDELDDDFFFTDSGNSGNTRLTPTSISSRTSTTMLEDATSSSPTAPYSSGLREQGGRSLSSSPGKFVNRINGNIKTSWNFLHTPYPYTRTSVGNKKKKKKRKSKYYDALLFLGKYFVLGEQLMPLLINVKGVVQNTEFFQRDNFLELEWIRQKLVTHVEALYENPNLVANIRTIVERINKQKKSSSGAVKDAIGRRGSVGAVLDNALLYLGRCRDVVRPAGLLEGSLSPSDWKKALRSLEICMNDIHNVCDPDQPLHPREWGKLKPSTISKQVSTKKRK